MKMPNPLVLVLWLIIVAAPLASGVISLALIPPGVEQLPMQFDFSGNVTRYGSPSELLVVGAIMSWCNVLMFLTYLFSDALYDRGLVNGVSRRNTRPFLLGCGIVVAVIGVGATILIASSAISAL